MKFCVFSTGFLKNNAVFQAFWLQIPQKISKNVLFFTKTYHFYIYFVQIFIDLVLKLG